MAINKKGRTGAVAYSKGKAQENNHDYLSGTNFNNFSDIEGSGSHDFVGSGPRVYVGQKEKKLMSFDGA